MASTVCSVTSATDVLFSMMSAVIATEKKLVGLLMD